MGKRLLVGLLVLALVVLARPSRADGMRSPIREADLPNGLHLVVDENAHVPLVTVVLAYRVGSAEDPVGRGGLASLTASLMSDHTAHVPRGGVRAELDRLATFWSFRAGVDLTTVGVTVEPNALARIFWLFSDGMGFFRDTLDQSDVDVRLAKTSVASAGRADDIAGLGDELAAAAMYPADHPYRRLAQSSARDLAGLRADEVKAFHAKWFVPKNAALIVAGDVKLDDVVRLATRYFGTIPGGASRAKHATAEVELGGETEIEIAAPVPAPIVSILWPTPAQYASGDAELDAVAGVLDGVRLSRLRWALESDKHLITHATAHQSSALHGSVFGISAVVAAGHTPREVVAAADVVLRELQNTPISDDDVVAAIYPVVLHLAYGMESARSRAYLYAGWLTRTGVAFYFKEDLARYSALTPAAVMQGARAYLPLDRRIVTLVTPDASAPTRGVLRHRTFTKAAAP